MSLLQDQMLRDVPTVDGYKVLEPAVLVEKLPEGGMAAVYRGLHLDLKVDVAVKVLKRSGEAGGYSPQAVARFRQEAEQAAKLNDPNLVRIYDFPANRIGLLYLVMEYIDGETVESRVQRKGRLTPHEATTIAYHAARGLSAAHAENVIHRDIKPPNILISKRGHVKVTDLGIAKAQDSAAMGMTQEITLLGTPQYMAPELWRGARFASAASDVFAVGATIAFMLTGRHVLDGGDTQEIMHRILTEGFPDVTHMVSGIPPQLAEVIRHSTQPQPNDRIAVDELLLMLRELLEVYHGEFPLADPGAGSTMQPLLPTRLPSRSDLARIRERLDQSAAAGPGTPIPGTLRVRDDPATVVAGAIAGRVDLYSRAQPGPAERNAKRASKKGGLGKVAAATAALALLGGAGWLAVHQGWLAGGPTPGSDFATTPTQPASAPATAEVHPVDVAVAPPTAPGANLIDNPPRPQGDPATRAAIPTPAVPAPPIRPPAVSPGPANAANYAEAKRRLSEAADAGKWADAVGLLHQARNLAEAESKRADFVSTADQLLMKFRAENSDLDARRAAFPTLPQHVTYIADGGSGAAALVAAEQWLAIDGGGPSRRLRSVDPDNGFANAVAYLDKAIAGAHPQAAGDATAYVLDARLGQAAFLAGKGRWADLVAWLDHIPIASMRGSTEGGTAADAARAVEAINRELVAMSAANPTPEKVRAVGKNLDKPLGQWADAGSQGAALLIAQSLVVYDPKGNLAAAAQGGTLEKMIARCEQARAGKDSRMATTAGSYLLDAYAAAAASATDAKAWADVIAWLAKGQGLATAPGAAPALAQKWRAMADRSVLELRKENPDLDRRREAFPKLAQDLQPLADASVYAARLALAEQTVAYAGEPLRTVPKGGDADFGGALKNLAACISSPDCPADIKQFALHLEWDIFASFVREHADKGHVDLIPDDLRKLAHCGGAPQREQEYDALVDELLKPDSADRAMLRVSLAEERLDVQENSQTGLRQIMLHDPAGLVGVKKWLDGAKQAKNADARSRANALIGEIDLIDPAIDARADGFDAFKEAVTKKDRSKKGDPVALMGLAAYYQLPDADLAALAEKNPAIAEVQKLDAKQRQAAIAGFYREAAFSGDKYACFLAGQFSWTTGDHTPERRDQAVAYLQAAAEKGHKLANVWLAKVRSGK